jgi:hypothetical protein
LSQVGREDCGAPLEGAEHLVLYHYVVEGRLTAQILNGNPVEIEAGEVVRTIISTCSEVVSTCRRCHRNRS